MSNKNSYKNITIKSTYELDIMYQANQIVAGTLFAIQQRIKPGISTWQLDRWAEEYCLDHNALPAFKGYRGFPASLCVSVNEQVVHGIPSKKRLLLDGDIVSIDFGVQYLGYYGDAAVTLPVGEIDGTKERLLRVTEASLQKGIDQAVCGNRVSDIARAIQLHVEANGFSVVRQFVGHGIGTSLHEGPEIPNYLPEHTTPRLLSGMVLAIEPMVNSGTWKVKVLRDDWTVVTADHKPSAHFEHSVAVTDQGPRILSKLGLEKEAESIV